MATRRPFLPVVALAALVASLAVLNWKLWEMPVDISPIAAGTEDPASIPEQDSSPPGAARTPLPLAELGETLARPLFHPSRRPVAPQAEAVPEAEPPPQPPPPAVAEPAPPPPSRLSLVGVMGAGPRSRRALIRPEGQTNGTWVALGEEVDGWRIARIEDGRVVIEKDGGSEELVLKR